MLQTPSNSAELGCIGFLTFYQTCTSKLFHCLHKLFFIHENTCARLRCGDSGYYHLTSGISRDWKARKIQDGGNWSNRSQPGKNTDFSASFISFFLSKSSQLRTLIYNVLSTVFFWYKTLVIGLFFGHLCVIVESFLLSHAGIFLFILSKI